MEEFSFSFPTTRAESVERIAADPELVLYDNYFSIRAYEAFQQCLIVDIPKQYDQKVFSYAFQKNSPYLDLFNFHLKVANASQKEFTQPRFIFFFSACRSEAA